MRPQSRLAFAPIVLVNFPYPRYRTHPFIRGAAALAAHLPFNFFTISPSVSSILPNVRTDSDPAPSQTRDILLQALLGIASAARHALGRHRDIVVSTGRTPLKPPRFRLIFTLNLIEPAPTSTRSAMYGAQLIVDNISFTLLFIEALHRDWRGGNLLMPYSFLPRLYPSFLVPCHRGST
ncbi:hypothetical protein C8R44DRAFT_894927 [Mycena epipterygia]|nr:hypothetical protein C8R44DRAFT_894927 [Mycena epipterygia]